MSIQTEYEVSAPQRESTSMVGLDAGVAKLGTLSDGTIYPPVNSFKANQRKLVMLQRQLSRKVKFSANWQKQKRNIQHLHSRIANIRRDYLHKVTTTISKKHAMIVIEGLKVSNMSKSAKGTADQHGRNVKAKSGLNRAILVRAGMNYVASLSTSSFGVVVRCWQSTQPTQVKNVPVVVIQRKRTARHKASSNVWNVDIRRTPI